MKSLEEYYEEMLLQVESELQQAIGWTDKPGLSWLHEMLSYHMGWVGEGAGPAARGKRIRPLLVLLTCAACHPGLVSEAAWEHALPAAAAVELVHNFSLIHDDIEDNSPTRRGRLTAWKKWGVPQALNTGDALYTIAHLCLHQIGDTALSLEAARILQTACLHLTEGQHLDLSFETRTDLTLEEYLQMIGGKTGALLAACCALGALLGQAPADRRLAYEEFGRSIGLAFQAQDDYLGIWGDAELTGKSTESDLVSGKKTLPVIYGLERKGEFARRWLQGNIQPEEAPALAKQLQAEGGLEYTRGMAEQYTRQALEALERADPRGEAGAALRELALRLAKRES